MKPNRTLKIAAVVSFILLTSIAAKPASAHSHHHHGHHHRHYPDYSHERHCW